MGLINASVVQYCLVLFNYINYTLKKKYKVCTRFSVTAPFRFPFRVLATPQNDNMY